MTELLPCPFCGSGPAQSENRFTNASFSGVEIHSRGQVGMPEVYCGTCAAVGPPHPTETEAITAWNRRAPVAPTSNKENEG